MLAFAAVSLAAARFLSPREAPPLPEPAPATPAPVEHREQLADEQPDTGRPPAIDPQPPSFGNTAAQDDLGAAKRLSERLRVGARLASDDLLVAEDLYARHPAEAAGLLEAVLLAAARQELAARRSGSALAMLARAVAVRPLSLPARRALAAAWSDAGDWPQTEAAARSLLAIAPHDAEGTRMLAHALVRQDRSREALELLAAFPEGQAGPELRGLSARLRRDATTEEGLGRSDLAHFHVRYDGATHEDVGREVLRVLDRHYAFLARMFDHQPAAPIPVVLLSDERYFGSTGAPLWAGGHYDTFDGRVRVPIGGLTAALGADLEETLLHELTHAFVTDLSSGLAPAEIQEGVAQLASGRRTASLGPAGLRALADGRVQGVDGFYSGALAFVEDLLGQRGQGGINDLLAAMSRTRDVEQAFQEVYGKDFASLKADSLAALRRRYGS